MQRRRTGGAAPFPPLGDYTLVQQTPNATASSPQQPALKGGNSSCMACNTGGNPKRYRRGGFYEDSTKQTTASTHASAPSVPSGLLGSGQSLLDILNSTTNTATTKGGADRCATGGTDRRRRGGAPVELTAFISALALLGARLLADKNSSFNLFSRDEPAYQEQVGGRPRRSSRRA